MSLKGWNLGAPAAPIVPDDGAVPVPDAERVAPSQPRVVPDPPVGVRRRKPTMFGPTVNAQVADGAHGAVSAFLLDRRRAERINVSMRAFVRAMFDVVAADDGLRRRVFDRAVEAGYAEEWAG